jgi:hypothetical protein
MTRKVRMKRRRRKKKKVKKKKTQPRLVFSRGQLHSWGKWGLNPFRTGPQFVLPLPG